MNKPKKGDAVTCTAQHPFTPHTFAGVVIDIDGAICIFRTANGDTDRFVWQFKDGVNRFYSAGEGSL